MLGHINVLGRDVLDFNFKMWPQLDLHPQTGVAVVLVFYNRSLKKH